MRQYISVELRRQVATRANFCCEYCRLKEILSFYNFHVDHIKSVKHDGLTILNNLAYACPDCNHFKGSDIGSFFDNDEQIARFFNPRKDKWADHFELLDGAIYGKTEIGKATERIFKFNDTDRLIFRKQLISLALYP